MTDKPNWSLYQNRPSFALGFHGTDEHVAAGVISGGVHLTRSENTYDWLGSGIYFWDSDPQRALEWAQHGHAQGAINDPGLVGAIFDLGICLDLTTRTALDEVARAYDLLTSTYASSGNMPPVNSGGPDLLKRALDCEVIEALHGYRHQRGLPPYDSVRAPFLEDSPLYPGAGFRVRNHIQIAVRNIACIKGYFRPIQDASP
ncbi:hypothetical protein [Acidithiobacillus ferrivorans]|uniref:hypothetical protein n=1 Tax=Acidithiobacillus ferrivorans TaxID=160808 RepID=UPI0009F5B343|nr:hypothetical protein [Acidithiobacillus ferrivorans]